MNKTPARFSDEQFEILVARLLRGGVLLAATIVAAGAVPYLVHHGSEPMAHHTFQLESADLRTPTGIVAGALALRERAWIQLGLLALIATPVLRVLLSVFAFARQGDRSFVIITLAVLSALVYSLFHGHFQ
jgi:uncharacterized membrane protein